MPAKENSREWWEARYAQKPCLYGREPSSFLTENLPFLPKGEVLDIACGEGRNAVLLGLKGYPVTALDFSETALGRARELAARSGVQVDFKTADLEFFLLPVMRYPAIAVFDYHPNPVLLKNLARGLASGGLLILEAYLIEEVKRRPEALEPFECFRPGELLSALGHELQVIYYDERVVASAPARVRCLARKAGR